MRSITGGSRRIFKRPWVITADLREVVKAGIAVRSGELLLEDSVANLKQVISTCKKYSLGI